MSDRELRPLRSIRITGDGRCLFRSVACGACLRRGKQSSSNSVQKELADELRSKVADEFVRRRGDTEWFLEGDFESYVRQMRKPHVWGEPELLMCSHVLRMPVTVYMYTKGSDSPRTIAEYGQEYGKDDPICVLYDGYGHYDALQPSLVRTQSRLQISMASKATSPARSQRTLTLSAMLRGCVAQPRLAQAQQPTESS